MQSPFSVSSMHASSISLPQALGTDLSRQVGTGQESMLCVGGQWTEDEANLQMKEFRSSWNDLESWEARADMIRKGIIHGMQLEKMP